MVSAAKYIYFKMGIKNPLKKGNEDQQIRMTWNRPSVRPSVCLFSGSSARGRVMMMVKRFGVSLATASGTVKIYAFLFRRLLVWFGLKLVAQARVIFNMERS